MDLVLDIGNCKIKGAAFSGDEITSFFSIGHSSEELQRVLSGKTFDKCVISTVYENGAASVTPALDSLNIPYAHLDYANIAVKLDVEKPEEVGHNRIANVYGALARFPQNECIVVDLGTAVTFDAIGPDGSFLGGAIYPGIDMGAKALHKFTKLLPEVETDIPEMAISKTTEGNILSGLYYGLLGAIERITFEMRTASVSPSDVKIIATGGLLQRLREDFTKDLSDLVDLIDPALTLIGIHEIMKEST